MEDLARKVEIERFRGQTARSDRIGPFLNRLQDGLFELVVLMNEPFEPGDAQRQKVFERSVVGVFAPVVENRRNDQPLFRGEFERGLRKVGERFRFERFVNRGGDLGLRRALLGAQRGRTEDVGERRGTGVRVEERHRIVFRIVERVANEILAERFKIFRAERVRHFYFFKRGRRSLTDHEAFKRFDGADLLGGEFPLFSDVLPIFRRVFSRGRLLCEALEGRDGRAANDGLRIGRRILRANVRGGGEYDRKSQKETSIRHDVSLTSQILRVLFRRNPVGVRF